MKLVWLAKANASRFARLDYIAEHNAKAALAMNEQIEKQTAQLEQFPEIGRPGRIQGTREGVIGGTPFVVLYRIQHRAGRIEIMHILHGSQQCP